MKIARVLAIRDGGAQAGPQPYYGDAVAEQASAMSPPPIVRTSSPPVRVGTDILEVGVAVDFALEPK